MSDKKKKKKLIWQQYIGLAFFVLIGAVCGFLIVEYISDHFADETAFTKKLLSLLLLLALMYVAIFLQMIIHESGHLIFGLLSGYQFSSFRIFSFMWVKRDGRIRFKRLSLAGTGGQCLMAPPEQKDGKFPLVLYNLGGSFMNVIAGLVFLGLYFVFRNVPYLSISLLLLVAAGFIIAVMNGVPMRMGTVDNDGYNAFSLTRSSDAMRSFWVQMKTNEQIASGVRLKDMPDEWFVLPRDEAMKNSMVAVVGVFACNRLMDGQRFQEAD